MAAGVLEARGGGWSALAASAVGAVHAVRGEPSQDAVAVTSLEVVPQSGRTRALPGVVAAVADGHGGPAYVRAAAGARCAVDVACSAVAALLPELFAGPGPSCEEDGGARALQRAAAALLVPALVSDWRCAVLADATQHPFTAAEAERAGTTTARLLDDPVLAYGTTLLLAAVWDGGALVVQLGDGDVLAVSADGATTAPLGTDRQRRGGTTASLCQPRAAEEARVAVLTAAPVGAGSAAGTPAQAPAQHPARPPVLLALATDGYGAAFADGGWRPRVGADLLASLTVHGSGAVAASLPAWLEEPARVGGDDATLALLHREGTC